MRWCDANRSMPAWLLGWSRSPGAFATAAGRRERAPRIGVGMIGCEQGMFDSGSVVDVFCESGVDRAALRAVVIWSSQATRAIRTAALGMGCPTSTGGLSTGWSSPALQRPYGLGWFILGRASHLDAFSGYHSRPSLPGGALGSAAGTRAGRPTRSSRTRVRPPQPSNAHDGYRPNCLTTF